VFRLSNMIQMSGGLFRLRNVTIVGYFYYLILPKLLHVSVVSVGSVVSRVILANIFLPDDGHMTETCSSLGSIK
jgi:hypothetical protein